jgi:hypothetical protein
MRPLAPVWIDGILIAQPAKWAAALHARRN